MKKIKKDIKNIKSKSKNKTRRKKKKLKTLKFHYIIYIMKLKDHVCMIKTKWRDIILNWCENEGKEHWDLIEKHIKLMLINIMIFIYITSIK